MKRTFTIILVFLSLSSVSQYINPVFEWEKSYGGMEVETYNTILPTNDGGFIHAGTTDSNDGEIITGNKGGYDIWVAKMDSHGNIEWSKTYGGSKDDYVQSIQTTFDGGFIFGGYTNSYDGDVQSGNQGWRDFWVVKIDSLGIIQWEKTYGGSDADYLLTLIKTSDNGYAMCGVTNSNDGDVQGGPFENNDFWVLKIDSIGTIQWQKTYGGSGYEYAYTIYQNRNQGYVVGGFADSDDGDIQSGNNGEKDFWLIEIDSVGNLEWERVYGGSSDDILRILQPTSDQGYILGGYSESDDGDVLSGNKGFTDCWIVKVSQIGEIEWERTYGGSLIEYLMAINSTPEGDYYLGCSTNSHDGDVQSGTKGNLDYWVIRINQFGNIIWEKTYGGSDLDHLKNLYTYSNGDILLSGHSRSDDGDVQSGNKGNQDFWVVKISENLGLESLRHIVNLYPNPIKDNWINIDINIDRSLEVRIIDIFGRVICNKTFSKDNNIINLEHIPSGFLILQVIDNSKIIYQQKLIKNNS